MSASYQELNLDELGFLGRGKSKHRPRNDPALYGGDYPFIQTGNVKAANLHIREYAETYNETGLAQSKLWDKGTLLITIAANIAETAILDIKACFPDSIVGFVPDESKVNSYFVKYYIDYIKSEMQSISQGTTQDNLSLDKIRTFKLKIPEKKIVDEITDVLLTYDNLIENNNRRIAILEKMAQSLYREWFVKFRFPGHENIKFIDSPLGKIPEGWEVFKVADLLQKVKRKKKIKKSEYLNSAEIPIIDQGRGFIGGYTDDVDAIYDEPLPIIIFGDHTRILKYIDFPFACGADGTQLLISNNARMPMTLFYYVLLEVDLSNFAYERHFKFLKDQEILLPDENAARKYDEFVLLLRRQVRLLKNATDNTMKQRDLLLPKLISGNIQL